MRAFLLFLIAYVLIIFLTPIILAIKLPFTKNRADYLFTAAIGFDQAGGSVFYGQENFTISSYTYFMCEYKRKYCWLKKLIDLIFGKNHCRNSYIWEIQKDLKDLYTVKV